MKVVKMKNSFQNSKFKVQKIYKKMEIILKNQFNQIKIIIFLIILVDIKNTCYRKQDHMTQEIY